MSSPAILQEKVGRPIPWWEFSTVARDSWHPR